MPVNVLFKLLGGLRQRPAEFDVLKEFWRQRKVGILKEQTQGEDGITNLLFHGKRDPKEKEK